MMFLFAPALAFGFANYIVPLQIGAPDVSFPRLNALAYWLYAFGGTMVVAGFLTPDGAADFGWFAYAPLNSSLYSPGTGADLWIFGLTLSGLGTIFGAVNLVTTILTLRAPGMTMFRMPIFCWNMLITGILVLVAFPVFAAASLALAADRHLGAHVFDASNGGAILWEHLFWFFGHPEVYIIALPFFGVVTEVLPVFSRKPLFGYKGLVFATIGIGALSIAVWAHHMFATGAVLLPVLRAAVVPHRGADGVKFFNWIGTMWRGQLTFETPMLWAIFFLVTFLFGGLTGVLLASPPIDFHVTDSYFVVAHFHYVVFGSAVFGGYAGHLFLVPEDDRSNARRPIREASCLDPAHRLPYDVPGPALAGHQGHAATHRRLFADRRIHHPEYGLHHRCVPARGQPAGVLLQRHPLLPARRAGEFRRPLGLRQFPGMGDVVSASTAQLCLAPAYSLRAAGIRSALSGSRGQGGLPCLA